MADGALRTLSRACQKGPGAGNQVRGRRCRHVGREEHHEELHKKADGVHRTLNQACQKGPNADNQAHGRRCRHEDLEHGGREERHRKADGAHRTWSRACQRDPGARKRVHGRHCQHEGHGHEDRDHIPSPSVLAGHRNECQACEQDLDAGSYYLSTAVLDHGRGRVGPGVHLHR